jgi:hypothetical protein
MVALDYYFASDFMILLLRKSWQYANLFSQQSAVLFPPSFVHTNSSFFTQDFSSRVSRGSNSEDRHRSRPRLLACLRLFCDLEKNRPPCPVTMHPQSTSHPKRLSNLP